MKSVKNGVMFLVLAMLPILGSADDGAALEQQAGEMQALAGVDLQRAEARVAGTFVGLAGSQDNADSLVRGLRTGSNVTLHSTDADAQVTTTVIDPATGQMGLGNVFISLALAQESLKQAGITEPTAAQLDAALNGGAVTVDGLPVVLSGVLMQRASGSGWGKIAQSLGVKLGPVVSALRSENGRLRSASRQDARAQKVAAKRDAAAERAERGGANRGTRPERVERPEKVSRPERPERPGRP